ncbi:MAG: hypothetical protein WBP16_08425 [Ferruginibacter sp.]
MKKYLLSVLFILFLATTGYHGFAQGCVAIKNMPCTALPGFENGVASDSGIYNSPKWEVSLNARYFRSYKHFVGSTEQKHRVEEGTEVINKVYSFDIGIVHNISDRYIASVIIPVIFNYRSSMYEHYGNSTTANPQRQRFSTQANGIGDVRFTLSSWILNPKKSHKGNFALGLGIKLPSGNAEVQDDFHKRKSNGDDSVSHKSVDQSIQLGDGGFGFSIEAQGYQRLFKNASLFYNGFYLFNPRNTNNNFRGGNNPITMYNSVPDQFAIRVGMIYSFLKKKNLSATLCGRVEGLPAHDAIGKSEGFRRPGYIISVEPGVSYRTKRVAYQLNLPVAVYRNRTRSVDDLARDRHGDAAFADYLLNIGVTYSFRK